MNITTANCFVFGTFGVISTDGEDRIDFLKGKKRMRRGENWGLKGRNEQNICLLSEGLSLKVSLAVVQSFDQPLRKKDQTPSGFTKTHQYRQRKNRIKSLTWTLAAESGRPAAGLRMVLLMMLCFILGCSLANTEDTLAGFQFCSFNGSTRSFFCLGNKVHEMPRRIPTNTTFVWVRI